MSNGYIRGNEALESQFPKLQTFGESVELLSRHCDPNMTQNEHGYALCFRSEVAGDVISGGNIETVEDHAVLNFEGATPGRHGF